VITVNIATVNVITSTDPPVWGEVFTLKLDSAISLMETVMATLQQVLDLVTQQDTDLDSVRLLITGLRDQVAQIGNLTPAQQAALDAIFDKATANSAEIASALAANVPA